jgi:hypothetical protein
MPVGERGAAFELGARDGPEFFLIHGLRSHNPSVCLPSALGRTPYPKSRRQIPRAQRLGNSSGVQITGNIQPRRAVFHRTRPSRSPLLTAIENTHNLLRQKNSVIRSPRKFLKYPGLHKL